MSEFYHTLITVPRIISALAVSPDGKHVAIGDERGGVHLRTVPGGTGEATIDGTGRWVHEGTVYTLSWSPDGSLLAWGGLGGEVLVWDRAREELVFSWNDSSVMTIEDIAWSPSGEFLAFACNHHVHLWNPHTNTHFLTYTEHQSYVTSIAWSTDETLLASGEQLGEVAIWRAGTGETVRVYREQTRFPYTREQDDAQADFFSIAALAFSPDGTALASAQSFDGLNGGVLHVFEVQTGITTFVYPSHSYGPAWYPHGMQWQQGRLDAIAVTGDLYSFEPVVGSAWLWQQRRMEASGYAACWFDEGRGALMSSLRTPVLNVWEGLRESNGHFASKGLDEREDIRSAVSTLPGQHSSVVTELKGWLGTMQEHEGVSSRSETCERLEDLATAARRVAAAPVSQWTRQGRFESTKMVHHFKGLRSYAFLWALLSRMDTAWSADFDPSRCQQFLVRLAQIALSLRDRLV